MLDKGADIMAKARILVVEDERIVAMDLRGRLRKLGYDVVGIASWGEEAIGKAEELRPDLALMDIKIKGELDGIEVAQHLRTFLDIPAIYLTAYADEHTLERAKVTEAFGYILKPFEERDLHTTIDMALYKHKMERRIKESERWLAATLNSISDAVIATDAQGCVKFMNPMAQVLTGWSEEDALGNDSNQVFCPIDGKARAPIESPIVKALSEGVVARLPQGTLLVARDGSEIPIEDSASPILDEKGNISGVVLVFRDITERVRAQEALRQYNAELQTQNAELEAFAHTVAHDLKNPIGNMIGYAALLQEDEGNFTEELRQECLETIEQCGLEACNIIDELLLLAAVRKSEVQAEPLQMEHIVTKAKRRLRYMKQDRQAEIVVPESWPVALGYGLWVEEVWVNYLSNGIKYGGSPPRLELGATAQSDGMVRFWIRDNGPGLEPEDQDRLFTPFTRLNQVRAEGHGLGLSIVQRIVDKLGGQVGVESQVGQGSTFIFTLPTANGTKHDHGDGM
jgi:PAS domain S-box-containing protein